MKAHEVSDLLALAQAFDNRSVGEANVSAWSIALTPDMRFEDAVEALRHHFATTSDYLMPVHVNQRVAEIRRQRVTTCQVIPEVPAELHQAQERAWLSLFWDAVKRAESDPQSAADAEMGLRRPELPAAAPERVAAIERLARSKVVPQIRARNL